MLIMKICKFCVMALLCVCLTALLASHAGAPFNYATFTATEKAPESGLSVADGDSRLKGLESAAALPGSVDVNNSAPANPPQKTEGLIEKGDTISKILENASEGETGHYVRATRKVFALSSFRVGQPYTVITDPDSGRVKRFEYEINSTRRLVVEGDEQPSARLEDIEYTVKLETASAVIDDNLFQAVADAGESPQLAVLLVELFGSEINFIKHIQAGDSFTALIEKRYRDGEYKGYGKILAARFTNRGKTFEAFLFPNSTGAHEYFNQKGENLRKTLLQAPLAVTRMTSRYTHSRKHPILGHSRPHLGVDYGAPTGTPVKAVGSGVVTKRGWAGGYGNQIVLRHDSSLESLYSHLSGFSRGLAVGSKVRQGQVIGYVGSTGLSTGPHLDFRLRQKGAFINPAKAINPRGTPVASDKLSAFKKIMELERSWLDGGKLPEHYTADSLLPRNEKLADGKAVSKKTAQTTRIKAKQNRKQRYRVKNRS